MIILVQILFYNNKIVKIFILCIQLHFSLLINDILMNFQKFKTKSYCIGGRHHSSTINIVGDITINQKTCKEIKLLIGRCFECKRKSGKTVSDKTIQVENHCDFFKKLDIKGLNVSKKFANANNVLKNPGRALDITTNLATAAAIRNPKKVLSTLAEVVNFYRTGSGLYLGNFI